MATPIAGVEVDGKVLDITCDQFNPFMKKDFPDVYFGEKLPNYVEESRRKVS